MDNVNIMAYDASGLMLNDTQVLVNFVELGNVPAMKINMVRLGGVVCWCVRVRGLDT